MKAKMFVATALTLALALGACTRNWPGGTQLPLPGVTVLAPPMVTVVTQEAPWVGSPGNQESGETLQAATIAVVPTPTVVTVGPRVTPLTGSTPVVVSPTPIVEQPTAVSRITGRVTYGIHVLDSVNNSIKAAELGVSLVKVQVRWAQIQQCGSEPNWGVIGSQVDAIRAAGLDVVMSVVTTPPCLNSAGKENYPPDDPQKYADFVGALAAKFQPYAIEVWNEQNLDREWGVPDPATYIALLAASRNAIKANSPMTIVIAGALAPTWHNPPAHWDDLVYWQEFGRLGGSQYADCVGVHVNSLSFPPDKSLANPYGNFDHHSWYFPDTILGSVTATGLPACITEFGVATPAAVGGTPDGFSWAGDISLEEQATWLVDGMRLAEGYGNVKMMIFWNLDFSPACGGCVDEKSPFSILDKNANSLPAFNAIKQALGR